MCILNSWSANLLRIEANCFLTFDHKGFIKLLISYCTIRVKLFAVISPLWKKLNRKCTNFLHSCLFDKTCWPESDYPECIDNCLSCVLLLLSDVVFRSLARAVSWYFDVTNKAVATSKMQQIKKMKAKIKTVHWDIGLGDAGL